MFVRENFLAPPVVPLLLSQSDLVWRDDGDKFRGERGWILASYGTKDRAAQGPQPWCDSIYWKLMKVHFARQTCAKSNQILSAAAPDSFIFCHASPHSCIRVRDAGGKFRGCDGTSSVGVSIGATEFAEAGGD
jgi:hypothetical protein